MTTKSTVCDRCYIGGQTRFSTQPSFVISTIVTLSLHYNNKL